MILAYWSWKSPLVSSPSPRSPSPCSVSTFCESVTVLVWVSVWVSLSWLKLSSYCVVTSWLSVVVVTSWLSSKLPDASPVPESAPPGPTVLPLVLTTSSPPTALLVSAESLTCVTLPEPKPRALSSTLPSPSFCTPTWLFVPTTALSMSLSAPWTMPELPPVTAEPSMLPWFCSAPSPLFCWPLKPSPVLPTPPSSTLRLSTSMSPLKLSPTLTLVLLFWISLVMTSLSWYTIWVTCCTCSTTCSMVGGP